MILQDYTPVEETNLPRYVRYRNRKVRVYGYRPKTEQRGARFLIIDHRDATRSVSRSEITFVKERKRA